MKLDLKQMINPKSAILIFAKKHWLLLAALVLGIVLLSAPGENGKKETLTAETEYIPEFLLEKEEKRIAQALKKIEGVGDVDIVLTLESSMEQKIARDEMTEYKTLSEGYELNSENTVVKMKGDEEKPIVLKYVYPKYKGALVVAENINASLRLEMTNAVAALTGLSSDKISVVRGKG